MLSEDKRITDSLIMLFDGDADQIQCWLETPNTALDEMQPEVWWRDGKAEELAEYLEKQVAARFRRKGKPGNPGQMRLE